MMKTVNLPLVGRVDTKSILFGVGVSVALMVLPKISDYTTDFIASVRNKIGGK